MFYKLQFLYISYIVKAIKKATLDLIIKVLQTFYIRKIIYILILF